MGLLDGMVAVVTGSSSGVGRSTAELFGAEGAGVVVNSVLQTVVVDYGVNPGM